MINPNWTYSLGEPMNIDNEFLMGTSVVTMMFVVGLLKLLEVYGG